MNKFVVFLCLSFCSVVLFACQSQRTELTLLDKISSISISESEGYGGLNETYFLTIAEEEQIGKFEEVLKRARAHKQAVDVMKEKPDYDLLVRYENGETHGFHLILGNKAEKSRAMYIGHENHGFVIPAKDTEELTELFNK